MAVLTGGRPLESGMGSFRLNPQLESVEQSSMSGLNASRKMRGDSVTLKNSTLNSEDSGTPTFRSNKACIIGRAQRARTSELNADYWASAASPY